MLGQCLNRGCSLMRPHRVRSAGRRKEGTTDVEADEEIVEEEEEEREDTAAPAEEDTEEGEVGEDTERGDTTSATTVVGPFSFHPAPLGRGEGEASDGESKESPVMSRSSLAALRSPPSKVAGRTVAAAEPSSPCNCSIPGAAGGGS